MKLKEAHFLKSIPDHTHEPQPIRPTFVLLGRSNVGKSSLINALLNRKQIAKTSSTPGKTRLINYFFINQAWYLVDVPGYGWARISTAERQKWKHNLKNYLEKARGIVTTFVLIDARHPPQKIDIEFINTLGKMNMAFSLIFTKLDLLKKNQITQRIQEFTKALQPTWQKLPLFFFSSSKNKTGLQDILTYIAQCIEKVID